MNLLPYDEFRVLVHLPPWEVCSRLQENVSERTFLSDIFRGDMKFKGNVQLTNFTIYRNIGYSNSGLPILHGELEEIEGGTKINVKMKLHKFVQLFLLIWITTQIYLAIKGPGGFISAVGMILVAGAIVYVGFLFEVGKSKAMFIGLFETEIKAANQSARPDR